ncbi:MAG: hypothetical protein AAB834_04640, partial [Patescibacteria group bacterium]
AGDSGVGNAIVSNLSPVTALITGNSFKTLIAPGATATGLIVGNSGSIDTNNNASYNDANILAQLGQVNWATTGTATGTTKLVGSTGKVATYPGSGAIAKAVGVMGEGQFQGGAVTDYYGLYSTMNAQTSVAVQNAYGLKIDDFAATGGTAPTNFYAIATDGGQVRFRASSATAFQVQNSSSVPLLTADTSNSVVYVGNTLADATGALLVVDTKNTAGDPTGINGGIYYNSNASKFRCFEGSAWADCINSATVTLQNAYDNSSSPAAITTTTGKNLVFNMADTATDANFLIDLQCDTSCAGNGKFAIQDDAVDIVSVQPGGAVKLQNTTNSANAFEVHNAAGTTIALSVNTSDGRVGIGAATAGSGAMLTVAGAASFGGSQTVNFTTPLGAAITTKIDIPVYSVGNASQVLALGLTSASNSTARGILVADARSVSHQASIGVLSPNPEADVLGLSWEGSNTTGYLKTEGANVAVRSASTTIATFLSGGNVGIGVTNPGTKLQVDGTTLIKTTGDAFEVQDSTGLSELLVDTSNDRIYIGNRTADTIGAILVLDHKTDASDPTGVNGAMYYNPNFNGFRCFEDSAWKFCDEPRSQRWQYRINEEFLSSDDSSPSIGEYGWQEVAASGGSNLFTAGEAKRPGIRDLSVSATTDRIALMIGDTNYSNIVVGGGETIEAAVKIPTLSTGAQRYQLRVGLCDSATTDCPDGIYFEYDDAASTNWRFGTSSNNTRTENTNTAAGCGAGGSAVAVATGWTALKIVVNSAATQVDFYVNGTFVGCN